MEMGNLLPQYNCKDVFNSLGPKERILTRTFWTALESLDLLHGGSNLDIQAEWEQTFVLDGNFDEPTLADRGYYRINWSSLADLVTTGQNLLDGLEQWSFQTTRASYMDEPLQPTTQRSSMRDKTNIAEDVYSMDMLPLRLKSELRSTPIGTADSQVTYDQRFNHDSGKKHPLDVNSVQKIRSVCS